MMASSEGSLPVISPITSALAISTQSSYFWWRHHRAAASGSPYVAPEAAPAGPATPNATAPATNAKVAVLAMFAILVFTVFLFSFRFVAVWLRKGSDVDLLVISKNPWSISRTSIPLCGGHFRGRNEEWGTPVVGIPHSGGRLD